MLKGRDWNITEHLEFFFFLVISHLGGNIFSVFSTYLTKGFTSPIFGRYFIPRQKKCIFSKINFAPPKFDPSVQFSHSVMSNSLWPHGLQHARPPCPSPTEVCSNLCPPSQFDPWYSPKLTKLYRIKIRDQISLPTFVSNQCLKLNR